LLVEENHPPACEKGLKGREKKKKRVKQEGDFIPQPGKKG
jgi:hypothetical protein